jgi:hypothetical protein
VSARARKTPPAPANDDALQSTPADLTPAERAVAACRRLLLVRRRLDGILALARRMVDHEDLHPRVEDLAILERHALDLLRHLHAAEDHVDVIAVALRAGTVNEDDDEETLQEAGL